MAKRQLCCHTTYNSTGIIYQDTTIVFRSTPSSGVRVLVAFGLSESVWYQLCFRWAHIQGIDDAQVRVWDDDDNHTWPSGRIIHRFIEFSTYCLPPFRNLHTFDCHCAPII